MMCLGFRSGSPGRRRTSPTIPLILVSVATWAVASMELVSAQMYTSEDIDTSVYDGRVLVCLNNTVSVNETCVCDAGFRLDTTSYVCVPCMEGAYKNTPGSSACQTCPTGSDTIERASATINSCLCKVGWGISANISASKCSICTPDTYKSMVGNVSCSPCPKATISAEGSTSVNDCQCIQGYTGPNGQECAACVNGTYKDVTGTVLCTDCPPHTTSGMASTDVDECVCQAGYTGSPCQQCGPATFKDAPGNHPCTTCPENSVSSQGADSVEECKCQEGYTGNSIQGCTQCAAGKFKTAIGEGECSNCPLNTYSDVAAHACTPCFVNSQIIGDATSIQDCTCIAGYYYANYSCQQCPLGQFKSESGNADCQDCAAGKYQDLFASMACTDCPALTTSASKSTKIEHCVCVPGYTLVSGKCQACSAGTYKPRAGNDACTPCPADTYSITTGDVDASVCLACSGFTSTYNATGSSSPAGCLCVAGYELSINASNSCQVCQSNHYCPGANVKQACTTASVSPQGSSGAGDCTCIAGYHKSLGVCWECITDYYCPGDDQMYSCPSNSSAPAQSSREEDCVCSNGFKKIDHSP